MRSRLNAVGAAAAFILTACSPHEVGEPRKDETGHPAGAVPYSEAEKVDIQRRAEVVSGTAEEQRADEVVACGLALLEAENRDLVASDAQLPPPWQVSAVETAEGKRVTCEGRDRRGRLSVVVDLKCTDVNNDQCHPLVRIDR